jgi:hypothetical protein
MQKLTENRCINYKCKLKNKVENSWEEAQEKIHCDTGVGKYHSGGHEWELMDRDKCSVLNRTWTRLVQLNWALWTSSNWISSIYCTCSKGLPIWIPQFGGEEGFQVVSTKTPQALYISIRQEHSLHLGWENLILRTTTLMRWERTSSVTAWEPRPVFRSSVFLTPTKYANAHTDCLEPQGDHMNSLPLDTEIPSLSSQEYTRTHTVQPRTA